MPGGVGELNRVVITVHALPSIGVNVLWNNCFGVWVPPWRNQLLCGTVAGPAVYGDVSVRPRLLANPGEEGVVSVLSIVKKPVVYAGVSSEPMCPRVA